MGGNQSKYELETNNDYFESFDQFFDSACTSSGLICVDENFTLGSTTGKQIRSRLGGLKWLQNQGKVKGQMLQSDFGDIYIYYLVTAKTSVSDSLLVDFTTALDAAIVHAETNAVSKIIIPLEIPFGITLQEFEDTMASSFNGKTVIYQIVDLTPPK